MQRGAAGGALADALPLVHKTFDAAIGPWTGCRGTNHVLAALPLEAMPPTFEQSAMTLRTPKPAPGGNLDEFLPAAEKDAVLVTCGATKLPLIATAAWGKGRVAQAAWNAGLIPNAFTARSRYGLEPPHYDYWEYWYAVMGRLIYWAAHKPSGVELYAVDCGKDAVKLTLRSDQPRQATVAATFRDAFGQELAAVRQKADLQAAVGAATVAVPPAAARLPFRQRRRAERAGHAGLRRRGAAARRPANSDGQDRAGDLRRGGRGFHRAFRSRHTPCAVRWNGHRYGGRHAERACYFAGASRRCGRQRPRGRARDRRRRGNAAHDRAADARPGSGVPRALHVARRGRRDPRSAVLRRAIRIPRELNRARFQTFFWGWAGTDFSPDLGHAWFERCRDIGMSANMENRGPYVFDRRELDNLNMPGITGSVGMAASGVTKADRQSGTGKPGPFSSPEVWQQRKEAAAKAAAELRDDNLLLYQMGDENRVNTKDVDFSPAGLALLRRWLRETQYADLAALNAQWKAQFQAWDDVMPMTEQEIKLFGPKSGSYAAWADQRQCCNWAYAQTAKAAMSGFFEVDKGVRAGPSGTQEAAVYSGQDYWLLMSAYNALSAYGGEQSNAQISYRPNLLRYTWAGYCKPNPILRTNLWERLRTIDRGIGIFSAASHVDPDFTLPECGRDLRRPARNDLRRGTIACRNAAGQLGSLSAAIERLALRRLYPRQPGDRRGGPRGAASTDERSGTGRAHRLL